MEDLYIMLGDMSSFSKCQKKVADYIRENFDTAAFMTAERLAEAANVSESTVIRFASELGFDSFSGLRQALQGVLRKKIESRELYREAAHTSTLRQTIVRTQQSLTELNNTALETGFDALCDVIYTANNIYITGYGKTYALASYAALSLRELRAGVLSLHAAEASGAVRQLGTGDVLLELCAEEGESEHISVAKKRGTYVERLVIGESPAGVHTNGTILHLGSVPAAVMFIDALCSRLTEIVKSGDKDDI